MHLAPVEAHDVIHRLHGEGLGVARILGDQQQVQAGFRRAARYRRQIDYRDKLAANIGHAQQRRAHAGRAGDGLHRHNFAQLEDVNAEQLRFTFGLIGAETEQQQFKAVR